MQNSTEQKVLQLLQSSPNMAYMTDMRSVEYSDIITTVSGFA